MIEELSMSLRNIICVTVLLTHVLILVSANKPRNFTLKLHPIDSPKLPFFPKNLTPQERYQIRVQMSKARAYRMSSSITNSTDLIINPIPIVRSFVGYYAAEISIGTPPQLMYLLVDTGTDLTWVQCDGCDPCFGINENVVRNFQFQFSNTYKNLPSNNPLCRGTTDLCQFIQGYGSGQIIAGVLATDSFILGPESKGNHLIPGIIFGCGFKSNELLEFDNPPEANIITGVLGLSPGRKSILNQSTGLPQSFGYCIPPDSEVEPLEDYIYLNFGYDNDIEGDIHITYFLENSPYSYYLTLNGISVNGENLGIDPRLFQVNTIDWSGGFIIDSGSRYSFLIRPVYDAFKAAVIQYFANRYGSVPAENPYDTLCFKAVEGAVYEFPSITLHLEGADFVADRSGTFSEFGGFLCMNFAPSDAKSIWGSTLMFNYRFIYDVQGGYLLFYEEICPVGA